MNKLDKIPFGHCTIKDLAYWMNERHSIWHKRFIEELPKPWTEDLILQKYKFTNVFRELDSGTIALQNMLLRKMIDVPALTLFNVIWYRYFNWYKHAEELGFVEDYSQLEKFITDKGERGKRVFTGAWMHPGVLSEDKYITYLRACKEVWNQKEELSVRISAATTIEEVCRLLKNLYLIGPFLAYEMACDLRFTELLDDATDKLTWANMGPGAQRGLKRLGLPHKNQAEACHSMRLLHLLLRTNDKSLSKDIFEAPCPFELREVEHSLCEFDKYQRVLTGQGRPRSKYPGV